ncbi:hypothetical protein PUNSTDRAFT_95738 [Punctularia strigosozonata HHB-11173 SS5]|uniref:uncharacterized protein n=1 Tax=Punctularia strigosozonata (strain HHB-11173) TaxID=741275 RepID=UPI000441849C|nr:uncharacterized protein PUNSTDRAFT_95738 [Punctularia strigosozonata HHB-11173 SS5]EIN14137.1 hypothetical protein PUNSTDRAFT_95738 [Punctularia strigosozonata HHB-11173 SS5]
MNVLTSSSTPPNTTRPQKRRIEEDENDSRTGRDVAMDRSPTPERPKRAVPKRARVATHASGGGDGKEPKAGKSTTQEDGSDVDVGLLLASLPSDALLPLLNSLLTSQPSLKPLVLSLIPRPTLSTALQSISISAKKLRDAYPYSNATSFSSASFGTLGSTSFGSARGTQSVMRDDYVLSRIRPHISEFVSTCFSYLPYFSFIPTEDQSTSVNTALRTQLKERIHPGEGFQFLQSLTSQILDQPPLTQSSLVPLIMPRLLEEWKAWVDRVDVVVNGEGGMFGQEMVQSWMRALDGFALAKGHGTEAMREIRDRFVARAGWLLGRQSLPETMEEL